MSKRYFAIFAMFIFAGSSRRMASIQMAARWNQSSSRGEREAHDTTAGFHDMTVGAPKRGAPTAKHSLGLGETHGSKVSNSEPTFRLQARGWPLRRRSPSALTRVRALDLVAGSAPEPSGGRLGTRREYGPDIAKD